MSQTNDPVAGGWYFYALRADTGIFTSYLNDYPKVGVWSDGWYMTANMFDQIGTGFGVRVWALNRSQMITGGALQEVHFDTCTDATCDALLPANYHGTTAPPAGAPNYMLSATPPDLLKMWKFHVDWVTPANSTFTGPTLLPISAFEPVTYQVPAAGHHAPPRHPQLSFDEPVAVSQHGLLRIAVGFAHRGRGRQGVRALVRSARTRRRHQCLSVRHLRAGRWQSPLDAQHRG
ncbi:hypothetical protein [Candidatus Amarolinea dominans]|uniref:hypothetical protein n=1 Tax=Candidatus Amarolinea dominans TaxID=3140696 RepID=UPI0031CC811E